MRVGSLFTGVLGLDWPWLEFDHAFVADADPDVSTFLAERLPGVPNLGDVKAIDWREVDPVDVLIGGGFPCQPFSVAGKGLGSADDRYLWPEVLRAVRDLRPALVVMENTPTVATRADGLARFAAELADVGYDLRWSRLRASDVGAAHRRTRWVAVAYPCGGGIGPDGGPHRGNDRLDSDRGAPPLPPGEALAHSEDPAPGNRLPLLPTPNAWDGARGPDFARARSRRETHGSGGDDLTTKIARLFPTPTAALSLGGDHTRGGDRADEPLLGGIAKLLPTPVAADMTGARNDTSRDPDNPRKGNPGRTLGDVAWLEAWGEYAPAVWRWAQLMGPPPAPTDKGTRLSARFVEWLMGFPPGWVTDLVDRRPALRLLGNAVVPHVAAEALAILVPPEA